MSRPAAPAYVIPTFGATVNYPAGADPWAGTATKVAPGTAYFVPNSPSAAQYFNYTYRQAFDTDQSAKDYSTTLLNWLGQSQGFTFTTLYVDPAGATKVSRKPIYNSKFNFWVTSSIDSGGAKKVYKSYDGGTTWPTALAWAPGTPTLDIVWAINPAFVMAGIEGGGGGGEVFSVLDAGATTVAHSSTSTTTNGEYTQIDWFAPASKFLVVGGKSTNVTVVLACDPAGASSVTNLSASVPAALQTFYRWCQATNGTIFVAIPQELAGVQYMTTTNGTTFTRSTNLPLLTGEAVACLTYGAADGIFMAGVTFVSSGQIRFLTSTNGTTWGSPPAGGAITEPNIAVKDIVATGTLWTALVYRDVGLPTERLTTMTSTDKGATWRWTDACVLEAANGPYYGIATDGQRIIASSGKRLLVGTFAAGQRSVIP